MQTINSFSLQVILKRKNLHLIEKKEIASLYQVSVGKIGLTKLRSLEYLINVYMLRILNVTL